MSVTGIVVALLAAYLGGAIEGFDGVIFGLLLGYALGAVIALTHRVKLLEKTVKAQLESTTSPEAPAAQTPPQVLSPPVPTAPTPLEPAAEPTVSPPPLAAAMPAPTESSASTASPPLPLPADTPFDRLIARVQAFFTEGNVVVKVGLIVLFIGVGFLLKLAAERHAFPIELRVAGVGVGGLMLLGLGWRLRDHRRLYGLSLQGGGIGIMYLTGFAAARLYDLMPLGLAFAFLLALVILSAMLAVLQDAKYLAFYGAAGGFLAPVLVSTGSGSHVALFSYYALLNLGLVGIAWYRAWRLLNLLGFVFTFVIGALWGAKYYRPAYFGSVEPFLLLFFLFFVLIAVLFAWRQPPNLRGYVDGTLVFGVPLVAFALQTALVQGQPYGLAFSALGASAFYIGLATLLWRRRPQGMRLLTEAFLALGVVFGSLAIPLALEGRWTTVAWALEGAALLWVGVRQQRMLARAFGLVLQLASGVMFIATHLPPAALPVFNGTYLGGALISGAGLFSSYYLYTHRQSVTSWERLLHIPFLIWGLLWWFGAGEVEIIRHVTADRTAVVLSIVFWSLSFLLLHLLTAVVEWPILAYPVLGQLYSMVVFLGLAGLYGFRHPFQQYGWLAWSLAFAVQYVLLYRWRHIPNVTVQQWHHVVTCWALVLLLTWEGSWLAEYVVGGGSAWRDMMLALVPGGMALFLLTIGRSLPWPVAAHAEWYQGLALFPILLLLWLYALLVGVGHAGNPWPLHYIPLLNPVDLVVLFIVCVAVLWHHRLLQSPHLAIIPARFRAYAIAVAAFAWLNGIIARTIHHWLDVPYTLYALGDTVEFQTTIAVLWTLVALSTTAFATRKNQRELWFVGAGLLAAVVVKLFLMDLKNSDTIARIVSFVVVGLLMLVIGYLSPLPPRQQEEQA
jgi:uncharacterized membrane protein